LRLSGIVLLLTQLFACSAPQDELRTWMDQERQQQRPAVQAIEPPQQFVPATYTHFSDVDPFDEQKLTSVLSRANAQISPLLANEMNRRKEPLEAFPIDNLRLVGSFKRAGIQYGLLKVDDLLYKVKAGDHVGQNYGKIMKITETEISINEIVQDAVGEWIDRPTSLQLQEEAQ
jgi:type IV pilus assembly protein PilP